MVRTYWGGESVQMTNVSIVYDSNRGECNYVQVTL